MPFIYLAPLQGFTDYIFRSTYVKYFSGMDAAMAPFCSTSKAARVRKRFMVDLKPENNIGVKLIPQILGNDPDQFLMTAHAIGELGYDEVNWNLGCPYPMVARKKRGSGLLPYPEEIDRFLNIVVPKWPGRISAKMRLGRFEAQEFDKLWPVLNQFPLSEVIIHPRLGVQLYDGVCDIPKFHHCADVLTHQVTYNGDIVTPADFDVIYRQYGERIKYMLGRGVLKNPFLPAEIKNRPKPENSHMYFKGFHDELVKRYEEIFSGPSHLLHRLKGFWHYFSQGLPDSQRVFKKIKKAKTLSQFQHVVDDIFSKSDYD